MGYWNPKGQFSSGQSNPQVGSMRPQSSGPQTSPGSWSGSGLGAVPKDRQPAMTTGQGRDGNWDWFKQGFAKWQGSQQPEGPQHEGYQGQPYQAPGAWGGGGMKPPDSNYDPKRAIEANIPYLQEKRDKQWADTAQRFGQTGMQVSTPYMEKLGDTARSSQQDLDRITEEYMYNDANARAQRDLQAQQNQYNRDLSAWGTHGGWQHQGQMADQQRDFNSWNQMGNWAENQAGRDYDWGQGRDQFYMNMFSGMIPQMMNRPYDPNVGEFDFNFG